MIKAGEQYLTDICTMKGCTVKIVIFYFFSRHDLTAPHTKFHVSQTPPSCFLLIYDPFLTNIWRKYFSCNHFTVLHQLKLKWSNLDQNWAKSQSLLFKIFKISNCFLRLHSALVPLSGGFPGRKRDSVSLRWGLEWDLHKGIWVWELASRSAPGCVSFGQKTLI